MDDIQAAIERHEDGIFLRITAGKKVLLSRLFPTQFARNLRSALEAVLSNRRPRVDITEAIKGLTLPPIEFQPTSPDQPRDPSTYAPRTRRK